jgi:histone acetyltransferase (RNA polymerase elongator complex component)
LTTNNIVVLNKKPSEEFLGLVDRLTSAMINTVKQNRLNKQLTQKIIEKAEEEELPSKMVRELIENALKSKGISDRTIRRYIPPKLKNQNMIRAKKDSHLRISPPTTKHDGDWKDIHLRSIDILELRNWCNQQLGIKRKTVRGFIDDQLYMP